MPTVEDSSSCCGVREIEGIQGYSPESILQEVCDYRFNCDEGINRPFFYFTAQATSPSGKNLMKFIQKNKLGTVHKMPRRINGNSGNRIDFFCWSVNATNLRKYANERNIINKDDNSW